MKKLSICFAVMISILCCFIHTGTCDARTKSTVLRVVNNLAGTKHDDALTQIMEDRIRKKIDNLYHEEDNAEATRNMAGTAWSCKTLDEMLQQIPQTKSDYLVYSELSSVDKDTHFNFLYHGKTINCAFVVRLIDIKAKREIFADAYEVSATDYTDHWFKGSGSVSKKALEKALFKAGEIISYHLPL